LAIFPSFILNPLNVHVNFPAFAVKHKVCLNMRDRDWDLGPAKLISTIVHEYMHANSHNGIGFQKSDSHFGQFCFEADEMMTDLLGFLVYHEMGSETPATYDTHYYIKPGSTRDFNLEGGEGSWLSLAFLRSLFNGKRKKMFKGYFFGLSGTAQTSFINSFRTTLETTTKKGLTKEYGTWTKPFNDRAKSFISIVKSKPHSLKKEFADHLIELIKKGPNHRWECRHCKTIHKTRNPPRQCSHCGSYETYGGGERTFKKG
jgi:hypothetical protein